MTNHTGPIGGPSRVNRVSASSDLLGSSPEFGEFASAAPLDNGDLLGSFDDPGPTRSITPSHATHIDLLGDDDMGSAHPNAIHVQLPPRPTEISPDYVPPRRSPRRMSQLSFPGPSSPPQVSHAGMDVFFHPRAERPPDTRPGGLGKSSIHDSAQSKLFNTLATSKLASRWKSAVDHNHGPHLSSSPPALSPTAQPIDVTHSTPFASAERKFDSYTPPSGAPGFRPESTAVNHGDSEAQWTGTTLLGRREKTTPVLTARMADRIRQLIPPRQRLSDSWTLIFSLDQHGASLATLYRLVENYSNGHRGAGNLLVVQDGEGNRFGAYINEMIAKREGSYFGGGESFLFRAMAQDVKAYRWTGKNQYFALCEASLISFGGGAGTYGLVLDSTFSRNSTATCPTFDNEILCSRNHYHSTAPVRFDCVGLEVWGTR